MKKTIKKSKAPSSRASKKAPLAAKAKVVKKSPLKKSKASLSDERVGILGGAFNPVHIGHLNSALTAREKLGLDRVLIIPALNPPHKQIAGPSTEDRVAMINAAIRPYQPELELSTLELDRGGTSYTVDTLKELNKTYKAENLFFIMGADAFAHFPEWKSVPELLKLANFVITTRPGSSFVLDMDEIPEGLEAYVKSADGNRAILKSKREIIRVELEDIEASATEIRKRLRAGHDVKQWLPRDVLSLINEKGFYKRSSPLVDDYREFSLYCARQALDKKALDLKAYDMTSKNAYADFSVICSATSNRHAASIAQGVLESVKDEFGLAPISIEGMREGLWVLLDYGSLVVHVFQDHVRAQYAIEKLWRNCPEFQTEIKELSGTNPAGAGRSSEARGSRA